jgi:hypothetical protein
MINIRNLLLPLLFVSQLSYGNDGNDLLKKCSYAVDIFKTRDLSHEAEGLFCMAFVSGVRDTLTIMTLDHSSIKVCFPKNGINTEHSVKLVHKYLKLNPNDLGENDALLVIKAFAKSYPCN